MVGDDPPLAHPLGPGRADIIGGNRLQQIAAGLPGDEPHGEEAQHQRRQQQMGQRVPHHGEVARQQPVQHIQPGSARHRARPGDPACRRWGTIPSTLEKTYSTSSANQKLGMDTPLTDTPRRI